MSKIPEPLKVVISCPICESDCDIVYPTDERPYYPWAACRNCEKWIRPLEQEEYDAWLEQRKRERLQRGRK